MRPVTLDTDATFSRHNLPERDDDDTDSTSTRPPPHLSTAMQRWWLAVVRENSLSRDQARLLLVTAAANSWDRAEQAREIVAQEGTVIVTPGTTKAHPLLEVERASRTLFLKAVKQLGI